MSFELYSLVLSIAVVGLGSFFLVLFLGYCLSTSLREKIQSKEYYFYLGWIGVISAISTLGALAYQFVYGLEVCALCWWQRIFMFPIEVIVFYALMYREKAAHLMAGTLATIGAGFAGYHYFNHFQNLVLGKEVVLPCGTVGLVPSCSEFSFMYFGFLTLPFMALVAFVVIAILAFFAHFAKRTE